MNLALSGRGNSSGNRMISLTCTNDAQAHMTHSDVGAMGYPLDQEKAMKVAVEHTFEVTPDEYEELYFDEPFNLAVSEALQLGRQLLRLDRSSTRIIRHVCYEPRRHSTSEANKAFGTSRASFIEELDYDVGRRRGEWRTIPNLFADRVRNSGTIDFIAVPGGVSRLVRGEVKVSLFGFGSKVEKLIVAEIDKSYASSAKLTNDWIANRRAR